MNQNLIHHRPADKANDEVNLADLVDNLLQHVWLISGVFAAILLFGIAYAILETPVYRADALIQVEDNKGAPLSGVQAIADALGASASPVSGEIEILRSRDVVMKAVNATNADIRVNPHRFPLIGEWLARRHSKADGIASAPFGWRSYAWGGEVIQVDKLVVPPQAYGTDLTVVATSTGYEVRDEDDRALGAGQVGEMLNFSLGGQDAQIFISRLEANPDTEFKVVRVSPIAAYRDILGRLTVIETGKQSGIIRLSFDHPDIGFAQRLVNAISSAYLTQNVERRSAEADQSLKFLEEQLPEIKRSVERAEDALNAFRTRTNTISVEKATDSLLSQAVEVERERVELQLKRDQLRQRYRPEHPELRALEAQLAALDKESDKVNANVSKLPAAQRDLLRLQRDAEVSSQLYVALLNNAQQLKVAKAGTVGNVRVIDFAVQDSRPVAPQRLMIVAIAAVIGLMLGVACALVARMLRPTVRDSAEVERATGLVSYANVPESVSQERLDSHKRDRKGRQAIVEGRCQLLALLHPEDPAIESLRSMRTGLAFALMGAEDKNIVITGATAALGKSFVSANLSVLLASAGKKVLLVETDMRRPQLGTYFGYGKVPGLSDVLAGTCQFDTAIQRGAGMVETLDVLPSGQIPPNPGELLLGERFSKLMAEVQDRYDHIIFDSAPILPVGDTLAVAQNASTVFLVVRAEVSTLGEVRDAIRKLEAAGIGVKGFIFNGVKRRRVGYGYAYKYYYQYGQT